MLVVLALALTAWLRWARGCCCLFCWAEIGLACLTFVRAVSAA